MKTAKMFVITLATVVLFSLAGCASSSVENSNKVNRFPTKEDIQGKTFEGESKGKKIKYEFHDDGSFVKFIDDQMFNGTWSYKKSSNPMMAYTFKWQEGEEKKGYLVTIMRNEDGTLSFSGYWYLTDAYITMDETVKEIVISE